MAIDPKLVQQAGEVVNQVATDVSSGKNPLLSKTLWVNVAALIVMGMVAIGVQDSTVQAFVGLGGTCGLAIVNMILRAVTGAPLDWGGGGTTKTE